MNWSVWLYALVSRSIPLIAWPYLYWRVQRAKEHPTRWREKLGYATIARPQGRLVWLNAVGLGEVLALRGLITALSAEDPNLSFLITSSGLSSTKVLAENMPPRTIHQFLPLDAPQFMSAFLNHWQPDLSIWAEQELWPNAIFLAARRKIPLAYVNARMTESGAVRRAKFHGLFSAVLQKFALITAQSEETALILHELGAKSAIVFPSLKRFSPPLVADPKLFAQMAQQLEHRNRWLLASSHPEDEEVALLAHRERVQTDAAALLVIVPRDPTRAAAVASLASSLGLRAARRSQNHDLSSDVQIYIVDGYGELGLWYRLCPLALIGGTFGPTEGHNPWEAASLGVAILHGPRTGNFSGDFRKLDQNGAALCVEPQDLATVIMGQHDAMAQRASQLTETMNGQISPMAQKLLGLMR